MKSSPLTWPKNETVTLVYAQSKIGRLRLKVLQNSYKIPNFQLMMAKSVATMRGEMRQWP